MFKKTVLLSVAVALIMLGLFVDQSSAAQENRIASASKRGSLLVFPLIWTFSSPGAIKDTIIMIGNDGASPTWVKCYWMDLTQAAWDFEFELTANQSVWFSAKTGNGSVDVSEFGVSNIGELKCFAVDINPPPPATTEVLKQFNFLYGSAIIIDTIATVSAYEYPAWAFNLDSVPPVPAGPLNLNGIEYDYCPGYLVYNFFSDGADGPDDITFFQTRLALSPCQQDLRQDKAPICTKAKFDIWNENESKLTGAYQCVKCWFEGHLQAIGRNPWDECDLTQITNGKCKATGVGGDKFTKNVLHTDMGRFRVNPLATTDTFAACKNVFSKLDTDGKTPVDVCGSAANQYRTPFLGVFNALITIAGAGFPYTVAQTTGTAAGAFTGGTNIGGGGPVPLIKWDAGEIQQVIRR